MADPVRPYRRRCQGCGGREVFPGAGRRGPGSAGRAGYADSGILNADGLCLTCEIRVPGPGARVRRRLPRGGRLGNQLGRADDPGGFTVRHMRGTYRVQYPASRPFELAGRLGETWGAGTGRTPVIVTGDGLVVVLDPRAIVSLNGRRKYGPRMLPRGERSPALRAWLAAHRGWDRARSGASPTMRRAGPGHRTARPGAPGGR